MIPPSDAILDPIIVGLVLLHIPLALIVFGLLVYIGRQNLRGPRKCRDVCSDPPIPCGRNDFGVRIYPLKGFD